MLTPVLLALLAAVPPLLPEALPCGKPGAAGGLAAGTDLTRYTIDTARFPRAVCNDGSPAVFYYAPHTTEEDRDKWFLFLQGGGSCLDGQTCAQRWCSIDTNFGMDKMTSTLSKPSIRANGLLRGVPENQFGTWNRVLVFYCSSDTWSGTATTVAQASAGNQTVEYTIHLQGSNIVDAVLDTLRNARSRRRVSRHDSEAPASTSAWPDLDSATHVIFAGSSGGGNGVRNNADRVGAKLRASNPGLVDYRALIDAIYAIGQADLDFAGSVICDESPAGCAYETWQKERWEGENAFRNARGDESCVAWHAENMPGSEWRCGDDEHVVKHHITTPFFLRLDLQDQLVSSTFVEAGLGSYAFYGTKLESEMRNFPLPEEARDTTPGLFIPQCRHHESVTTNEAVYDVKVDGLSFHDTVWNWWRGAMPQQAIRTFAGEGVAPDCPNAE